MAPQRAYETVALPGHTTISAILQAASIDRFELMDLNPDLPPDATTTPPASSTLPYRLNVPTGTGSRVVQAWPELARVGMSVRPSTNWAPALVAKSSSRAATGSGRGGGASKKPATPYFVYRVAAGNTLAGIADAFGVGSYKEIMRWNSTKRSAVAEAQQLKIYRPYRKVQYKVRKGDTLDKVSKRFQVSVEQLRFYNGLGRRSLVAGQVLHVYVRSG
jgi:LysM repeat protein